MRSAEEKKTLIVNCVGYGFICALVIFTLTLVFGNRFFGMMQLFGLEGLQANPGFIYDDCSLPENKNNKFCQPKESYTEKDWKDIKHSGKDYVPFNLVPKEWEK
ncbi:MAG: hypothetical protein GYA55_10490 [SAR324 cluster bacterium]|uniref:Uncharacterized protein n=1 Tax=SAR324 cluster bacterium TaxID=2024889 RepID=A0A7X9FTM3_9DELT|nr:hypothetical protein [SAR324 cluster bacterium]